MFHIKYTAMLGGLSCLLGGCGYVDAYEEAVYDEEPIYCYQSLANVECYKEPNHRDKRRMVNYYGPQPTRYDESDTLEMPELAAPEEIEYWVKDPEPMREQMVKMDSDKKSLAAAGRTMIKPMPRHKQRARDTAVLERMGVNGPEGMQPVNSIVQGGTLIINGNRASVDSN